MVIPWAHRNSLVTRLILGMAEDEQNMGKGLLRYVDMVQDVPGLAEVNFAKIA